MRRGERHPNSKLTPDQVREIRTRLAKGEKNCDLAEEFGVNETNISWIKHRRTWQHIE